MDQRDHDDKLALEVVNKFYGGHDLMVALRDAFARVRADAEQRMRAAGTAFHERPTVVHDLWDQERTPIVHVDAHELDEHARATVPAPPPSTGRTQPGMPPPIPAHLAKPRKR